MGKNIGFVSRRFAGTDGVTLEASKWAEVFKRMGHQFFWFAGHLDRNPEHSYLVPEAFFRHEKNQFIDHRIFGKKRRDPAVTDAIYDLKSYLKIRLRDFIQNFSIDLLMAENVLTIPMHIALGVALTEYIAESQIPTIAHHHDFYWERTRFLVNAVGDYLRMAFPPNLPNIAHVVTNSAAQEELDDPRYKLVISHEAGDEGLEYGEWLKENARLRGVDLRLVNIHMADPMNPDVNNHGQLSLWDVYPHADFITYPSLFEGFGNALLEAVYFKRPLLINRYATFVRDIEPKGFDLVVMDGFLTNKTVAAVKEVLESPPRRDKMVNTNYEIASRNYSYAVLRRLLNVLLTIFLAWKPSLDSSRDFKYLARELLRFKLAAFIEQRHCWSTWVNRNGLFSTTFV